MLAPVPISAPAAERMALAALRTVGLGEARLLGTRRFPEVGNPPAANYTVQCRAGSALYEVRVSALRAKVWAVERRSPEFWLSRPVPRRPTDREGKAALAFARRLGVVGPLRVETKAETYGQTTEVRLCRLVRGRRLFVGDTPIGADATVDAQSRFVAFGSHFGDFEFALTPAVKLLPPKVALARYLALGHREGQGLRFVGPPEQILYTPQYRQSARPAYAVPLRYGGPRPFVSTAFVDAATGAFLHR